MQNNEVHKLSEGKKIIVLQHDREKALINNVEFTKP